MDEHGWNKVLGALSGGPPDAVEDGGRPVVLFSTHWIRLADGWSIASRSFARAMETAGIDVRLSQWDRQANYKLDPEVAAEVGHMTRRPSVWNMHVFGSMLAGADAMVPVLDNLRANAGPQGYYCVFERRSIEPALVDALKKVPIWVQCRMNHQVLEDHGVESTHIPYPYFDDDPHLNLDVPTREPRVFYYIGRFEPRKAPENVIKAFMRAFNPGEAELVIKPSFLPGGVLPVRPEQVIAQDINDRKSKWNLSNWRDSIRIIDKFLSAKEMLKLHEKGDIYVSASRGEGLDLPMWAAKLSARRIITTASGGPEDFLCRSDLLVPPKGFVPADDRYGWGEGATYIDYDLDDLVAAMQKARSEPACGDRTWPTMINHRAKVVGSKLWDWIELCREKKV